jgi:co-chaperonin GroES (HSP10)
MQSPTRIIVSVEKRFNDETKSGLYVETSFKPEHHVVISGQVIATAKRLPKEFTASGFYDTVEVGDRLYFHYLVVLDPDCHLGEDRYIVDYFQALATVRNDKVYAVGEHILIEPMEEEVTHSTLIIPEMSKKRELNCGRVFASNDPTIPEGSIVEFDAHGKFENEIEGHRLFVMYNSNIMYIHEKK